MKLTYKQKRKVIRTVQRVLNFLIHPLTRKEINTITRDYKRLKNKVIGNTAIYQSLLIPDQCFKTNKYKTSKSIKNNSLAIYK